MYFECAVCHSPIEEKDRDNVASLVKCGHICHFKCLEAYLGLIKECPQCESKVAKGSMIRIYPRPGDGDNSFSQGDLSREHNDKDAQQNIRQLTEDNNRLKKQIEDLKKHLSDSKKEIQIWEILFKHLSRLQADKQVADDKLVEMMKKSVEDLERELISTKADLVSTKADLDSTRNCLNSIKIEPNQGKNGIKSEETYDECIGSLELTLENSNLKSELENVKKQLRQYDKSVTDLVVQHSIDVDKTTEHNTQLNALNEMLTEINASIERDNRTLAKEKAELLEEINVITAERISIYEQNNALEQENGALKNEKQTLQRTISLLQQENDALKCEKEKLVLNKHEENLNENEINNLDLQKQTNEKKAESDLGGVHGTLLQKDSSLETSNIDLIKENEEFRQKDISIEQNSSLDNITERKVQVEQNDVSLDKSRRKLELKKLAFERCFWPEKRKTDITSVTSITPEKKFRNSDGKSDGESVSEKKLTTSSEMIHFDAKQEASTSRSATTQPTTGLSKSESQDSVVVVQDSQLHQKRKRRRAT